MKTKVGILVLALCLFVVVSTASALQSGDFIYSVNTGGISVTITGYTGSGGAVVIPSNIDGKPVATIGDEAFYNCDSMTSITIPDSVISIGYVAFRSCDNLASVTIGNSVTTIGDSAFHSCTSLTSVTIPDSVTSIGRFAFNNCTSLTSVTIPDSVTTMGDYAFNNCTSLTSVTIGNSVTTIGDSAFTWCTSLTSVTIGNSVTTIERVAFATCTSLASVTIPDSVTTMGDYAFSGCTSLAGVYFQGNPPSLGLIVLNGTTPTVYYMHGTTGWQATFGGRPTVLWNPLIQTGDGSFGVQSNSFGFNISESLSGLVVVKACTNLTGDTWNPVQTNTMTGGSVYFSDPSWTNHPSRYYRLSMP